MFPLPIITLGLLVLLLLLLVQRRLAARRRRTWQLHVRVHASHVEVPGGATRPALLVEVQGEIHAFDEHTPVHYVIEAWEDGPDGERRPLLCALPHLQEPDTRYFRTESRPESLPGGSVDISSWTRLLTLPVEALTFPRRGRLTLRFRVICMSAPPGGVLTGMEHAFPFDNPEPGYLDTPPETLWTADRTTACLAALAARRGGAPHPGALPVIERWIQKVAAGQPDPAIRADVHRQLSDAVSGAVAEAGPNPGRQAASLAAELGRSLPIGGRNAVHVLLMEACGACGMPVPAGIAAALGMDPVVSAHLLKASQPGGLNEVAALEASDRLLLGLTPGMNPGEIRRQLNAEYRRWNNRTEHPDPKVREQAQNLVAKIANYRRRLE